MDNAIFIYIGNDAFDAANDYAVNTNESNDYWHSHGQHDNGAISNCADCVAEGNSRGLSGSQLQQRAKRIELGRVMFLKPDRKYSILDAYSYGYTDMPSQLVNGDPFTTKDRQYDIRGIWFVGIGSAHRTVIL